MTKPKLFISSSAEGLKIAYAIQDNLKFVAEITVWDQDVFNLSESSLDSLVSALELCDFGVFIFSPDDYIKIRGKKDLAVRDNVIFELGLFIGKLGSKRSFMVIPDEPAFHLPTDLIGFSPAKYETKRSDGNLQAATGSASNKIRDIIMKLGSLKKDDGTPDIATTQTVKTDKSKLDWVHHLFDKKDYKKASEILKKKIRYTKDLDKKINLKGWLCYTIFEIDTSKGTKEYEKLVSEYSSNNLSYIAYANNLIRNNSYKKALEIVQTGLSHCERVITLITLKAKCLWETNQNEEALRSLTETLEIAKDPLLFTTAAEYYIKSGDKKKAINLYHTAYIEYPRNKDIIQQLAEISYDLAQYELSVLLYNELINVNPNESIYWANLGNAYIMLDLYNLSLQAYEKALELTPLNKGWIYANIGNLYSNKLLHNKAEENLKTALTLDSEAEYSHNRLSSVYKAIQDEKKKVSDIMVKAKAQLSLEILVP